MVVAVGPGSPDPERIPSSRKIMMTTSFLGCLIVSIAAIMSVAGAHAMDGEVSREKAKINTWAAQQAHTHKVNLPNGLRPEGLCSAGHSGFFLAGLGGTLLYVETGGNSSTVVATEQGVLLTGIKYDAEHHMLYAAGALSGKAFIYTLARRSFTQVAHRQLLTLSVGGYINDVAIGATRVYFSDSFKPYIHSIPRMHQSGQRPNITKHFLGPGLIFVGVPMVPILEGANGLVEISPGILVVANYKQGQLYLVDTNGNSGGMIKPTELQGKRKNSHFNQMLSPQLTNLHVPSEVHGSKVFPDGLILDPTNSSILYVADNFNNRLLRVHLDFETNTIRARLECVIKSPDFNTPTTLAVQRGYLWAVNAHLLDCMFFLPCTWQQYEMIGIKLEDVCR